MLKLADHLKLPPDAVTEKLAWLGRTGSGKTYGAMKLAELMLDAGAQIGALDPVGVWRGLRVPAQKGGTSFDVVVFGGLYGDLPLQPTAGALIADVVCDRGISFVLDVSQFIPAEQQRFAKAFAERFFQRRKAAPAAVHLFLEECQEFLPQNPMGLEADTLHEFQRLWKIGRNFGIGGSLISQRPQEINKKALNMTGTLFAFQMMAPQERKAVKEWVADHGVAEDIIAALQKLEVGCPHVESPMFLSVSKAVCILPRVTADLSSTPKVGGSRVATRPLTPIDVEQLKAAMVASIEKAKADDPRELRKRIVELERQVKGTSAAVPVPSAPAKERRVLTDADRALLEKLFDKLDVMGKRGDEIITAAQSRLEQKVQTAAAEYLNTTRNVALDAAAEVAKRLASASFLKIFDKLAQLTPASSTRHNPVRANGKADSRSGVRPIARTDRPAPRAVSAVSGVSTDNGYLPPGEKATLIAAAQYPDGITREQASVLTGYKRSSRDAYIKRLIAKGFVVLQGGNVLASDAGVAALGADYEPLPTGEALQRYWIDRLPPGEKAVLAIAIDAYPNSVPREALEESTGYKRSSRDAYIQRLQARQLLEKGSGPIAASAVLFES